MSACTSHASDQPQLRPAITHHQPSPAGSPACCPAGASAPWPPPIPCCNTTCLPSALLVPAASSPCPSPALPDWPEAGLRLRLPFLAPLPSSSCAAALSTPSPVLSLCSNPTLDACPAPPASLALPNAHNTPPPSRHERTKCPQPRLPAPQEFSRTAVQRRLPPPGHAPGMYATQPSQRCPIALLGASSQRLFSLPETRSALLLPLPPPHCHPCMHALALLQATACTHIHPRGHIAESQY